MEQREPTEETRGVDRHVPAAGHYDLGYLAKGRVFSHAAQIDAVLAAGPSSVLEVGVGTGISAFAMRRVGIDVTTLDVQPELSPDILGDVRAIPRPDASFDVSCCCQVLEHLPFAHFAAAVRELRRVTRWRLVLSLPDITRSYGVSLVLPWFGRREFGCSIAVREPSDAWKAERLAAMGHYWEIGMNGVRARTVTDALRTAGFARVRSFRVPELSWHRFFIADVG